VLSWLSLVAVSASACGAFFKSRAAVAKARRGQQHDIEIIEHTEADAASSYACEALNDLVELRRLKDASFVSELYVELPHLDRTTSLAERTTLENSVSSIALSYDSTDGAYEEVTAVDLAMKHDIGDRSEVWPLGPLSDGTELSAVAASLRIPTVHSNQNSTLEDCQLSPAGDSCGEMVGHVDARDCITDDPSATDRPVQVSTATAPTQSPSAYEVVSGAEAYNACAQSMLESVYDELVVDGSLRVSGELLSSYSDSLPMSAAALGKRIIPRCIQRSAVSVGNMLGCGAFGDVFQADFADSHIHGGTVVSVAVKAVKQGALESERVSLVKEATLMAQFSGVEFGHPHIISLIGLVEDGVGQTLAVFEFCKNGSLQSYLRQFRDTLADSFRIDVGVQLADAMGFLANRGYVHRDLAARNVLVDAQNSVKISDFGMARKTKRQILTCIDGQSQPLSSEFDDTVYAPANADEVDLPIQWTAPEVLETGLCTSASDVWSFGMTMVEVFTNGETPFGEMTPVAVVHSILIGRHPPHPARCPAALFEVLQKCWSLDRAQRPHFEKIRGYFEQHAIDVTSTDDSCSRAGTGMTTSLSHTKKACEGAAEHNASRTKRQVTAATATLKPDEATAPCTSLRTPSDRHISVKSYTDIPTLSACAEDLPTCAGLDTSREDMGPEIATKFKLKPQLLARARGRMQRECVGDDEKS
jgi:serine/threonine protein kinase